MIVPDAEENPPPPVIRLAGAIVLGALGFVTGAIATWLLSDLPGVSIADGTTFWVACGFGLTCLGAGFLYGDKTLDALGEVWRVAWELSVGILATLRALIR